MGFGVIALVLSQGRCIADARRLSQTQRPHRRSLRNALEPCAQMRKVVENARLGEPRNPWPACHVGNRVCCGEEFPMFQLPIEHRTQQMRLLAIALLRVGR